MLYRLNHIEESLLPILVPIYCLCNTRVDRTMQMQQAARRKRKKNKRERESESTEKREGGYEYVVDRAVHSTGERRESELDQQTRH